MCRLYAIGKKEIIMQKRAAQHCTPNKCISNRSRVEREIDRLLLRNKVSSNQKLIDNDMNKKFAIEWITILTSICSSFFCVFYFAKWAQREYKHHQSFVVVGRRSNCLYFVAQKINVHVYCYRTRMRNVEHWHNFHWQFGAVELVTQCYLSHLASPYITI